MKLKKGVALVLFLVGVFLALLFPGSMFPLPLCFLIGAGALYAWGFREKVPMATESTVFRALEISQEVWIVAYIDPNTLDGGVEILLQSFQDPDAPERELLVYKDHPGIEKFRNLKPKCIIEFSFHPEMMMEGVRPSTLSSYLSVFRIHKPGSFIHPKGSRDRTSTTSH